VSLALLAPVALAGLAALAVPLALHVVRRAREREHAFAALRWIAPRARPRRRLDLEERALLALRLALVAGVAGLLAAPAWRVAPDARPWTLVAPGVDLAAPDLRAALAAGRGEGASGAPDDAGRALHWLAPGLPPIAFDEAGAPRPLAPAPAPGDPLASPSSLLRALDARLPPGVALQAWVPARLEGLDGERIALARTVDWRVLPASAGAEGAIATARPRLALRAPPERDEAARVLAGVLRAWAVADGVDAAALDASSGIDAPRGEADVLAWLHPEPPGEAIRAWAAAGRTLLVEATAPGDADADASAVPLWRDDDGRVLASAAPLGRGRLLRLHVALRSDALPALRAPGFPSTLAALLRAAPAPAAGDAAALAPRHVPALAVDAAARAALDPGRRDLRPWLALLLGLLAVAERVLALRRGRWTA
jgi:hypothetical protein